MVKHLSPMTGVGVPLSHDWAVDAWTPFTSYLVNPDGPATATKSVTTSYRGRVAGQSGTANAGRRDMHVRSGTLSVNSRVRATWWGGNLWDTAVATPQMGICQRFTDLGGGNFIAVVITNNIFLTNPNQVNVNLWGSDGTTLALGDVGGTKDFGNALNRSLAITSTMRFDFAGWINSHTAVPSHLYGLAQNDLISVNSSDSTFNATNVTCTGANAGSGSVSHTEPTTLSAVALKIDTGTITPPIHKRYWPMEMVSELVGNILRLKVWRYMDPEPDWGEDKNVYTYDISSSTNLTEPTGPGLSGVVSAHLRSSCYVEWGRLEFTALP